MSEIANTTGNPYHVAAGTNEKLAAWVRWLEENRWVELTTEEQMNLTETADDSDEMFWVAVELVDERDLWFR